MSTVISPLSLAHLFLCRGLEPPQSYFCWIYLGVTLSDLSKSGTAEHSWELSLLALTTSGALSSPEWEGCPWLCWLGGLQVSLGS